MRRAVSSVKGHSLCNDWDEDINTSMISGPFANAFCDRASVAGATAGAVGHELTPGLRSRGSDSEKSYNTFGFSSIELLDDSVHLPR